MIEGSILKTMTVTSISATDGVAAPTLVCQCGKTPQRVLVRNNSLGGTVLLAFDSAPLQNAPAASSDLYELPAGQSDIFVLFPKQKLFAASPAANPRISVAISDALPIDLKP